MSPTMLRAGAKLGPNTVGSFSAVVQYLVGRGHPIEVVDSDPAGADLLWACGLLTAQLIAGGAELDVVAAPVFGGETDPVYRSVIIARRGETAGPRRLAVNEYGSWSGYHGPRQCPRLAPWLGEEIVISGSHVDSIAAVAAGQADAAAIDHSVWDWVLTNQPGLATGLTVVETSDDWPSPPLSVGGSAGARALVEDLLAYPPSSDLAIVPVSLDRYRFMAVGA